MPSVGNFSATWRLSSRGCAERSSYGRAQSRSEAAFNMDGAIAGLLLAVAFSEPGSDSFGIGVCAVVMAPPARRAAAGIRGRLFNPASRRGTCGLSWPGRADVTGTGDGGHGRESWFAAVRPSGSNGAGTYAKRGRRVGVAGVVVLRRVRGQCPARFR